MRARAALSLSALVLGLTAGAASAHPFLGLDFMTPGDGELVPAERFVAVDFDEPVAAASMTPQSFTVHERDGSTCREGAALPGGVVRALDHAHGRREGAPASAREWELTFPTQLLGSGAVYCVGLRGVRRLGDDHGHDGGWSFSTMPDERAPAALATVALADVPGGVRVSWEGPLDFDRAAVVVLRADGETTPGIGREGTTEIGTVVEPGRDLVDTTAQPGRTYTYGAYPIDRDPAPETTNGPVFIAGSITKPALPVAPAPVVAGLLVGAPAPKPLRVRRSPRLLQPRAVVMTRPRRPLVLRWRADPRARFYNIQLFRGSRKLLTTFPVRPRQRVRVGLLSPGRYTVRVWTGLGPKRLGRYAPRPWLQQTLVIRRR